jgi:hypothetical protein
MTIKSNLFLQELNIIYLNFVRIILHIYFPTFTTQIYISKLILYMVLSCRKMAKLNNKDFTELAADGSNYLTWAMDVKLF